VEGLELSSCRVIQRVASKKWRCLVACGLMSVATLAASGEKKASTWNTGRSVCSLAFMYPVEKKDKMQGSA